MEQNKHLQNRLDGWFQSTEKRQRPSWRKTFLFPKIMPFQDSYIRPQKLKNMVSETEITTVNAWVRRSTRKINNKVKTFWFEAAVPPILPFWLFPQEELPNKTVCDGFFPPQVQKWLRWVIRKKNSPVGSSKGKGLWLRVPEDVTSVPISNHFFCFSPLLPSAFIVTSIWAYS